SAISLPGVRSLVRSSLQRSSLPPGVAYAGAIVFPEEIHMTTKYGIARRILALAAVLLTGCSAGSGNSTTGGSTGSGGTVSSGGKVSGSGGNMSTGGAN